MLRDRRIKTVRRHIHTWATGTNLLLYAYCPSLKKFDTVYPLLEKGFFYYTIHKETKFKGKYFYCIEIKEGHLIFHDTARTIFISCELEMLTLLNNEEARERFINQWQENK